MSLDGKSALLASFDLLKIVKIGRMVLLTVFRKAVIGKLHTNYEIYIIYRAREGERVEVVKFIGNTLNYDFTEM